ncbi:hypothetical protein M9Y10_026178 [Tritrichomonas musculus]|uniref:RGS domain-containing protein n=1 Tax=Tritrichomonas musculus TaxID=1915356 RepID=A0ABR2H6Y2_9EUKA
MSPVFIDDLNLKGRKNFFDYARLIDESNEKLKHLEFYYKFKIVNSMSCNPIYMNYTIQDNVTKEFYSSKVYIKSKSNITEEYEKQKKIIEIYYSVAHITLILSII